MSEEVGTSEPLHIFEHIRATRGGGRAAGDRINTVKIKERSRIDKMVVSDEEAAFGIRASKSLLKVVHGQAITNPTKVYSVAMEIKLGNGSTTWVSTPFMHGSDVDKWKGEFPWQYYGENFKPSDVVQIHIISA